ncbi:MAG: caspase family protein [Oscillatoriophycideae cyanobacterium NC_groundwater_1537_Pr4_S-0.65um_50_18]|nr:caspase family protein [Oscillatoriophycideae cyanobacterium NC_groundwater_1537_Pr4_S-0.65um_50_18]
MATGIAIAIGLNAVDPAHYGGWSGNLIACEFDANDMAAIAKAQGFTVSTLLTRAATRQAVLSHISDAAQKLQSGDILMLSYSGHGGQLPDLNSDESDRRDETWCLFDGELVDDELYGSFSQFAAGVRILVFSDSCHSGTVTRDAYYASMRRGLGGTARDRCLPRELVMTVYHANQSFYDPILKNRAIAERLEAIKASVLLISGCQDNQTSADGDFNGLFTGVLKEVWNAGKFKSGYRYFHRSIQRRMPPYQTPNYMMIGAPNRTFEHQKPFTV